MIRLFVRHHAQSNQIRQAVGDGNFEPSRLAQLADKLNNFRYELQLKLTDALTNQICSSKQKLDKPLFAFSFFQIKCDIFFLKYGNGNCEITI